MTDEKAAAGGAGRRAVEELVASGGLDGLFEQIDAGQISLTGADGLLPALLKETLERGLQAELTDHLGYDKGERAGQRAKRDVNQDDGTPRWARLRSRSPATAPARSRPAWCARASGAWTGWTA